MKTRLGLEKIDDQDRSPPPPAGVGEIVGTMNKVKGMVINPKNLKLVLVEERGTHVAFVIRGSCTLSDGKTKLPPILFRIRKADIRDGLTTREVRIALEALNSYIALHQHLTVDQFNKQMDKMAGEVFHFLGESQQESILHEPKPIYKKVLGFLRTREWEKKPIVDRTRFFARLFHEQTNSQYAMKKLDQRHANELPVYEFDIEVTNKLADIADELIIDREFEPLPDKIHIELQEQEMNAEEVLAKMRKENDDAAHIHFKNRSKRKVNNPLVAELRQKQLSAKG